MATSENKLGYHVIHAATSKSFSDRHILQSITTQDYKGWKAGLFLHIEISDRWHHSHALTKKIEETYHRTFAQTDSQSALVKFETCLKALNTIIEKNHLEINAPIHAVAICLYKNEVHLSVAQNAQVFLSNNQFSNIANRGENTSLFASVTSGDLSTNDTIIVPSEQLVEDIEIVFKPGNVDSIVGLSQLKERVIGSGMVSFLKQTTSDYRIESIDLSSEKKQQRLISPSGIRGAAKRLRQLLPPFLHFPSLSIKLPMKAISLITCFIILLGSGLLIARSNLTKTEGEVAPPVTLLTEVKQTSLSYEDFVNTVWTSEKFSSLSDQEQAEFIQILGGAMINRRSDLKKIADIGSAVIDIATAQNEAFLLDANGGLWRLRGELPVKVDQAVTIQNPVSLVALAADKFIVTDSSGNVWLYNNQPNQPTALALPSNLPPGSRLVEFYQNNLYLLNSDRSIVRVANFVDKLDQATTITKKDVLPPIEYSDWKIPSEVYLLGSDGRILSVNRNKLGGLSVTPSAKPQTQRLTLIPSGFAVSSGRLITIYNTAGLKQLTFFIPNQDAITALSALNGQLIFACRGGIYTIALNATAS